MITRKFVVGLCALCSLSLSVIAVQGAGAAIKGTTMFTCKKTAGETGFSKEHCNDSDAVGTGAKYQHVSVAQGTSTEVTVSNAATNAETNGPTHAHMHVVITGIEVEIEARSTLGVGFAENKVDAATGDHFIHGTGSTTYKEVAVVKPAGCSVESGEIVTKELTGTSLGQGMAGKLQPASGTTFAEFNIVGPTCPEAVKGNYKVTGSITCSGDGSTVVCTRAGTTEQGTLKVRNVKAGVDVKTTAKGREKGVGEYTPLSVTTVQT